MRGKRAKALRRVRDRMANPAWPEVAYYLNDAGERRMIPGCKRALLKIIKRLHRKDPL